ncbi:MAG: ABC transporter substrate-binding protein, partial [Sphaerochaetaceae bacterium]|nr:ABC transporter substrate-binding protein [Sphaerochaetaceae bacterium]
NESNAYAVSLVDPFVNVVEKEGKKIVDKTSFSSNDKDFKTLLNDSIAANVDAIYVPGYTREIILIAQQARAMGYEGNLIFGLDACPPFNTLLGEPADGIYFINNYDTTDTSLQYIIDDVKATKGIDVTNKFFLGYDIANVYAAAFKAVGTDSVAIRDYVENLTDFEGLTGTITMNSNTHFPEGLEMYIYTYEGSTPVMLQSYAATE